MTCVQLVYRGVLEKQKKDKKRQKIIKNLLIFLFLYNILSLSIKLLNFKKYKIKEVEPQTKKGSKILWEKL